MTYYNHYNLDETEEEMNTSAEVYQMQYTDIPILIQDVSRTQFNVISDGFLAQKSAILRRIEEIYSVDQTQFRQPNELSIFMEFPIYDPLYFHNKILAAIDQAFNI